MANLIETTTPLGVDEEFTSGTVQVARGLRIVGSIFADQDGTIFIEQAPDGTNWDVSTSYFIASEGAAFDETLVANTFRIRYENGSTPQTEFRLFGNVRDALGDFVVEIPTGPDPGTRWFTAYYDPGSQQWVVARVGEAGSGVDANGLAAQEAHVNGKYASFDVALGSVDMVTLQEFADTTSVDFDS